MTESTNKVMVPFVPVRLAQNLPPLNLPMEIVVEIFRNFSFEDIKRFGLVCVQALSLSEAASAFWQGLFYRSLPNIAFNHPVDFEHEFVTYTNFQQGLCLIQQFESHGASSLTCQALNKTTLISGNEVGVIEVWDIVTGEILLTLRKNVSISSIAICQNIAFFGCHHRKTIEGFDLATGETLMTLESEGDVSCLVSDGKRLISGHDSIETTDECGVTIWDLQTKTAVCSYKTKADVTALCLEGDSLYVGDDNGLISHLLITSDGTVVCQAQAKMDSTIWSFAIYGNELFVTAKYGRLQSFDRHTLVEDKAFSLIEKEQYYHLATMSHMLFASTATLQGNVVRMWDLNNRSSSICDFYTGFNYRHVAIHDGVFVMELGSESLIAYDYSKESIRFITLCLKSTVL